MPTLSASVQAIKAPIDNVLTDNTIDNASKLVILGRVKQYVLNKTAVVQGQIAANPPSNTNVPSSYILCTVDGKPFARFEDGTIKAYP